jgi:hypothetical protein
VRREKVLREGKSGASNGGSEGSIPGIFLGWLMALRILDDPVPVRGEGVSEIVMREGSI